MLAFIALRALWLFKITFQLVALRVTSIIAKRAEESGCTFEVKSSDNAKSDSTACGRRLRTRFCVIRSSSAAERFHFPVVL